MLIKCARSSPVSYLNIKYMETRAAADQEMKKKLITIRVMTQRESDVFFRIGRDVALQTLILGYCGSLILKHELLRFVYDGKQN